MAKTAAQLDREINEALKRPARGGHSTKKTGVGDEIYAISGGRQHGPGIVEEIYDDGTMRVDFTRQFGGRLRIRPEDVIFVPGGEPKSRSHATKKQKKPRIVHVQAQTPTGYRWLRTHVRGATVTPEGFAVTDEHDWAQSLAAAGAVEIK